MLKTLGTTDISELLKEALLNTLDDHKAKNVTTISLKGKSDLADYMIIVDGTSVRHVASMAKYVGETLDELALCHYTLEGQGDPQWMIVDNPHVIVHLFHPEYRKLYQLEKMWMDDDLFAELDAAEAEEVDAAS